MTEDVPFSTPRPNKRRRAFLGALIAMLLAAAIVGWIQARGKDSDLAAARQSVTRANAERVEAQRLQENCGMALKVTVDYVQGIVAQFKEAGADFASLLGTSLGFQSGWDDIATAQRLTGLVSACS